MKQPGPDDDLPAATRPRPSVTVAICTHDRIEDVRRCCEALAPGLGAAGFGLLIVDSASEATAAEALRDLARGVGARHLRCDLPGLSRARNAACAESASDWIAFLDDDTLPSPGWASALGAALDRAPPDLALIGGRTTPLWPANTRTDHVTARWKLLLSCVEDEGRGPVSAGHNICGANMAVRREAVARAGGFPRHLGRIGTKLLGGEESFLIERLTELGLDVAYDGSVAVGHRVSEERMTREWVTERAFWEGATQVAMARALGRALPRHLWKSKLALSLPILAASRFFRPRPDALIRLHMAIGALTAQIAHRPPAHRNHVDADA